jgi:ABC-type transport system substrate-binding protein
MSNIFRAVQFGEREIRPAVAERWDISPDGRVHLYLRESAAHNGRRVRSDDVKYRSNARCAKTKMRRRGLQTAGRRGQFMSGADSVAGFNPQ